MLKAVAQVAVVAPAMCLKVLQEPAVMVAQAIILVQMVALQVLVAVAVAVGVLQVERLDIMVATQRAVAVVVKLLHLMGFQLHGHLAIQLEFMALYHDFD